MSAFLATFLPYISTVLAICLTIGGMFAIRQGYSKQVGEIQDKVISAQKAQITTLEGRVEACEKEVDHLHGIIETISEALRQRGIVISISGEMVTIEDAGGGKRTSLRRRRQIPVTRTKKEEDDDD